MSVRTCVSALSVVALLLAGQHCQSEPPEEASPAAEAEPMEEEAPPGVSDTVRAGETFELVWPTASAPLACIQIPADVVAAGTVVTIDRYAGEMSQINQHCQEAGKTCYRPIIDISATKEVKITNPESFFTVGICAGFGADPRRDPGSATAPGPTARIVHVDDDSVESLPRVVSPCGCRGPGDAAHPSALGPVDALLAGTILRPAPLHAAAVAYEGLGGKGGSLSPFLVVRPPERPQGQ